MLLGRCNRCKNKNLAECILADALGKRACPHGLKFINNCEHEFYTKKDFTKEEYARHNKLAIAVLDNKRRICKRCSYEETK